MVVVVVVVVGVQGQRKDAGARVRVSGAVVLLGAVGVSAARATSAGWQAGLGRP